MKPPTVFTVLVVLLVILLCILFWPVLSFLIWNIVDSIQTRRRYRVVHKADAQHGIQPGISLGAFVKED